ncbi:cobalamin biosynthesis protein [Acidisarcina polymorpha]|nr:cobalamin biosynthesis protein [Acidisarcina polymorpha]
MISSPQISIGFGCSSRANCDDIIQLIQACTSEMRGDGIVATLDRRAAMGALVAETLGLRLVVFPASTLAKVPGTSTHSPLALTMTDTGNVAEASALASLGPGARLVVRRRTGRFCTCAVAALPQAEDQ